VKTDPHRAEQDEQILRLRCAGLSLRAIGARVGLSHQGVSDRITAALAELVTPVAEEYRQLEAARLDDLTRAAYQVLGAAETQDLKLKAIDRLTKLSESRRKLWALDMPQPIDVALSRRLDVEGDVVADAVAAALEVLGLDEERRMLALRAAVARLSGEELPAPVSAIADTTAAVDDGQAVRAGMEARLRDLVADEGIDVDALLAEVDEEEGRTDG
jgi:DNA-binding transcriptional MerR regulator